MSTVGLTSCLCLVFFCLCFTCVEFMVHTQWEVLMCVCVMRRMFLILWSGLSAFSSCRYIFLLTTHLVLFWSLQYVQPDRCAERPQSDPLVSEQQLKDSTLLIMRNYTTSLLLLYTSQISWGSNLRSVHPHTHNTMVKPHNWSFNWTAVLVLVVTTFSRSLVSSQNRPPQMSWESVGRRGHCPTCFHGVEGESRLSCSVIL